MSALLVGGYKQDVWFFSDGSHDFAPLHVQHDLIDRNAIFFLI